MNEKSLSKAYKRLSRVMPGKVVADKPLTKFTTLRVGGPAAIFATIDTLTELRLLLETISDYELPALILGRGSNLLISDEGVRGIVFQLGEDFKSVVVEKDEVRAGGAATLAALVQTAWRNQLAGLAFAVGIPGTVGAAVALNVGAHGGEMGRIVKGITYYTKACELKTANADELSFGYRTCRLAKGAVILETRLGLTLERPEMIKSQMETYWRRRKKSQPMDLPNAGSMFKNPPDDFAGRLIEAAGFKGKQIGGAMVSEKHANFFVNTGAAKAADFYQLIQKVAADVKSNFGVELELEIKMVGDWSYASR